KGLLDAEINLALVAKSALGHIKLAGRFQKICKQPAVFVDVAHNPQAAQALSSQLTLEASGERRDDTGKTWAIVAMLADKDISGVLQNVAADIDHWCFAGLEDITRGMPVLALFEAFNADLSVTEKVILSEENRHDLALNQCTMLTETVLLSSKLNLLNSMVTPQSRVLVNCY
ncbi:MAG: hypothetical protein GWP20_00215, partial [Thermotogales bacterium]|nr:hypothetical protein [Thermotogales bacterium]